MRFTILLSLLLIGTSMTTLAQENSHEPPFGLGELQAYSVFVDAYRHSDYALAIDYGQWILNAQPRELEGHQEFSLERQFERMIDIYIGASENETDPSQVRSYLRDAHGVFERFFEAFDEDEYDAFKWQMRLGRFYHEYHEEIGASRDDAMAAYEKMYKEDSARFAEEGDGFFARVLLGHYASTGQVDNANEMIDEIEQYAGAELQSTIDEIRESLFESPQDRIDFFESRVADAEGDEKIQMLETLRNLYSETGQNEKGIETAIRLYELSPGYENSMAIADFHLDGGNYSDALQYLENSMNYAEALEQRGETSLMMAEAHQQLRNLQSARSYAEDAANYSENPGRAYMRLASIYAAAVSQCAGGDALERRDRTVYWLVLDYYDMAAKADPSLASDAASRSESYKRAMPSAEDKFFSGWEVGESFNIDGSLDECYAWIDRTTTVR